MAILNQWTCGQCGAVQGMTEETERVLRQSSATFYCVHGHARHWPQGKSREERLKEELAAERRRAQSAEQRVAYYADKAEHERRRANGYKGHATRITKRVKAGVCICCNRSFKDLARHMATKHPTLTPIDVDQGATVQ